MDGLVGGDLVGGDLVAGGLVEGDPVGDAVTEEDAAAAVGIGPYGLVEHSSSTCLGELSAVESSAGGGQAL